MTAYTEHLTLLNGIPSERGEEKPTRADARGSDWRFDVLAKFEELMRSYKQEALSR